MNPLEQAVERLSTLDEWDVVRRHIAIERENLIAEFSLTAVATDPNALCNLAGKIEVMDGVLLMMGGPPDTLASTP
jgi:hypothetical protein